MKCRNTECIRRRNRRRTSRQPCDLTTIRHRRIFNPWRRRDSPGSARAARSSKPQSYRQFADQRRWLGIPNFADVTCNFPFAVVGIWGLWFVLPPFARFGLFLTAFGSSYYHWAPDNARLVWDRLPMTLVVRPLVAAMIAERISLKAGLWLLPLLTVIGAGSIRQWYASELHGEVDLRMYAAVQAYALAVLLLALPWPPRYTRGFALGRGIFRTGENSGDCGLAGLSLDKPYSQRAHPEASGGGKGRRLGAADAQIAAGRKGGSELLISL
jgi:hypothetical protein